MAHAALIEAPKWWAMPGRWVPAEALALRAGPPAPRFGERGASHSTRPEGALPLCRARAKYFTQNQNENWVRPSVLIQKKRAFETFWATFRKEKKYFFWRKKFVSNRRSGPKMAFFCSSLWPLFKFLIWAWEKLGTSETRTPQTAILAVF